MFPEETETAIGKWFGVHEEKPPVRKARCNWGVNLKSP